MNRKKFFTSLTMSAVGLALFNSFPLKYFSNEYKIQNSKVKLKINPMAVNRKTKGGTNV